MGGLRGIGGRGGRQGMGGRERRGGISPTQHPPRGGSPRSGYLSPGSAVFSRIQDGAERESLHLFSVKPCFKREYYR